jgi:drug/metabolite transporter (DMT)-like permease
MGNVSVGVPAEGSSVSVRDRVTVMAALFSLYIIWGSTYLGIRYALEGFPPFLLGGIRFVIAGGALYTVLRLRGAAAPRREQWIGAGIVGLLLIVGGNGGVTFAEQSVASGLAALGVASTPLWIVLFAGLWGNWPARREWLGLLLGFGGVVLLNLEGDLRANPWGAAALLLATLAWSFGSIWSRHLRLPDGLMASAAQMLIGGVVMLLISLGAGERIVAMPSARALGALVYLITFGSLIAYSAYGYVFARLRPALAASYAYVNPLVAVGLGVGLAGEQIGVRGVVAMLVILASVGLLAVVRKQNKTAT